MAKLCCLLALLAASPALGRPRGLRALFAGDAADARSAWEYLAGDKGYKRCDHVAKKPDPRCGRVSDDGVVANVACPKTCGTCG